MIAHLQGMLVVKTVERVVLDVHGVGYQAVVPLSTYYALPDLQERVTLLTTMYVREDTMRLYGFATPEEQEMFELLIGVSSVGPRLALNMLSSLTAADLRQAIAQAERGSLGEPGRNSLRLLCLVLTSSARTALAFDCLVRRGGFPPTLHNGRPPLGRARGCRESLSGCAPARDRWLAEVLAPEAMEAQLVVEGAAV